MVFALGVSWRKISNRFVASAPETKLTPVMLPPGRFRLVTRPSLTGVASSHEYNWHRRARVLGRKRPKHIGDDDIHRVANKFVHQPRKPINLIVSKTKFDRDILALIKA